MRLQRGQTFVSAVRVAAMMTTSSAFLARTAALPEEVFAKLDMSSVVADIKCGVKRRGRLKEVCDGLL